MDGCPTAKGYDSDFTYINIAASGTPLYSTVLR